MLKQLPNFAGLVVAILVQAKLISDLSANNRYLTNVIVNRENCEKTTTPRAESEMSGSSILPEMGGRDK